MPTTTPTETPMTMSITELERALRQLRLSGMCATLETRAIRNVAICWDREGGITKPPF